MVQAAVMPADLPVRFAVIHSSTAVRVTRTNGFNRWALRYRLRLAHVAASTSSGNIRAPMCPIPRVELHELTPESYDGQSELARTTRPES